MDPFTAKVIETDEDARDFYEERWAIAQFDGGLTEDEAEQLATERVREYVIRR